MARWFAAALWLLPAAFFAWLIVRLFQTPVDPPWAAGWMRLFVGSLFGSVALLLGRIAWLTARGHAGATPVWDRSICVGCGDVSSVDWCASCGLSHGALDGQWQADSPRLTAVVTGLMGTGLTTGGAGLATLTWWDDAGWVGWLSIPLGLMVGGVGALMVFGTVLVARDVLRGQRSWDIHTTLDEGSARRQIRARVELRRGGLVVGLGESSRTERLQPASVVPPMADTPLTAFAALVAALHAHGSVELLWQTRWHWDTHGARVVAPKVCQAFLTCDPEEASPAAREALERLALSPGVDVFELWSAWEAEADALEAQWRQAARALAVKALGETHIVRRYLESR